MKVISPEEFLACTKAIEILILGYYDQGEVLATVGSTLGSTIRSTFGSTIGCTLDVEVTDFYADENIQNHCLPNDDTITDSYLGDTETVATGEAQVYL